MRGIESSAARPLVNDSMRRRRSWTSARGRTDASAPAYRITQLRTYDSSQGEPRGTGYGVKLWPTTSALQLRAAASGQDEPGGGTQRRPLTGSVQAARQSRSSPGRVTLSSCRPPFQPWPATPRRCAPSFRVHAPRVVPPGRASRLPSSKWRTLLFEGDDLTVVGRWWRSRGRACPHAMNSGSASGARTMPARHAPRRAAPSGTSIPQSLGPNLFRSLRPARPTPREADGRSSPARRPGQ